MSFTRNPNFTPALKKTATERLVKATEIIRDTARARLDRPGGGELHGGYPNRSSSPGESPVSQTGYLSSRLQTYAPVDRGDHLAAAAGTDWFPLVFIERGTASMAPRPLLLPSLLQSKPPVMKVFGGGDAAT